MRCFVAVDVSEEVRAGLGRAQDALRRAAPGADVRWVDPAGIHLTLKFLGEVPDARVAAVSASLAGTAARAAPLALGARGLGGFPSARRPRVVWAGVVGDVDRLRVLAADVERTLAPLGFPPEARPFGAHLTLGRVRSPRGLARLAAALAAENAAAFGAWTVTAVVLYRSRLRRTGAVYEPVARLALQPRGG